ncbi:mucin-like protein [Gigantopelta aegis]|uniref:mucin-like protein n=1 Tax=Gigantopelta aegis TaxID=1735272 RepID=UPI001B88B3BE|nr:mucin-like protein [Gigantopelta aegis]
MTGSAKELFPNRRKAVFFVSFVLTFQALTVLAEDAMSLEDEYLLPVEKKNSLFDLYNSRQQLPNMASHDAFSSMTSNVNDNLPYDINMMDIDIANNRQERAVEGCGDGIDQCSDPLLNNCTGPFARCIELDFGFECGCQEPYEWNTKAWTCVWKMYPFGNAASASAITGDDVTERLEVSAGIPFYRRKHTRIFIGSNGVVSFGRRYNPIVMEFPPDRRSVLCPYCADVDVSVTNTGSITYRLYDKNDANNDAQVGQVLQRASRDVETYTRAARFAASQVLIVTWYKVPKYGSDFPEIDYVTFQLVLVTDGETTYAMYIYNEMNWIPDWDPIVIGYGENWNSRTVSVSGTRGAYGRRNIGGSRGQSGFYIFRVGFVESYAQKCRNWFAGQVMEYYTNRFYYDDLPDCPCTVRRLRFDRRWRRIWGVTRNRLRCTTLNLNWNFYPMGKMCCYRNGIFVENGVNAGYAFRYHQWYSWAEHYVSDTLGKNYCCDRSNFCPLFHTIRPAGQCSRTSVFRQGGGFGDPHVATLDGKTFIFNGHGEYILINIAEVNMTFDLQARTGQADNG